MRLLICGLLLCACSETTSVLRAELPSTSDHRSAIIAFENRLDSSAALELFAVSIEADGSLDPLTKRIQAGVDLHITSLLYDVPLEALSLGEGRLTAVLDDTVSGDTFTRPLPETTDRFQASIEDGELSGWSDLETLSLALQDFRLRALQPCTEFNVRSSSTAIDRDVDFVTAVNEQGAVIGTGEEIYYFEDGRITQLDRPDSEFCGGDVIPARYRGGYQAPDGALWLTARCGEIWRTSLNLEQARIEGGVTKLATHRDNAGSIIGPRSAQPPKELFVLGRDNGIWDRMDLESDNVESVHGFSTLNGDQGDLAYIEDGHAVAIWKDEPELARYRDGETTLETIPGSTGLAAVAHHPSFGTIVGDNGGRLFYRFEGEGDWLALPRPSDLEKVRDIAPYEGTFVYLDGDRKLRQYSTETRALCDPVLNDESQPDKAKFVAVIGKNILLIGSEDGGTVRFRWLSPVE